MPTYEYKCEKCGKSFDAEQRISDAPLTKCAVCGEEGAKRQISSGNFVLRGSGWYADGYSGGGNK